MRGLFETPARQAATQGETGHRPWPLPDGPWWMAQTWEDLLFAHWRVAFEPVRALIPPDLELDRFDGDVWLGVTPFCLTGLRARGMLPLPRVSAFPELNVRTYVTAGGKPGIWFFSLDCASALAVEAARRLYHLPYHRARMRVERHDAGVRYSSSRSDRRGEPVVFSGEYAPVGERFTATPGTLEYFLTERYCLYSADGSRVYRADIHHPPWPLQTARARIDLNTMAPDEVELPRVEPLLHFAGRQDVLIWPAARI